MEKSATGITEEGRRKYFEFPYHAQLKDTLKGLGAKWDADTKRWWAAKNHKNITKMEEEFYDIFSKDAPKSGPTTMGKEYEFEFSYSTDYHDPDKGSTRPLREVLKALGARWDSSNKVWYSSDTHPNFKRMTEVFDAAMGRAKKIDDAKKEKIDAAQEEIKRRRTEVPYLYGPYPQNIVKIIKDNGGIFDGKAWLLPDRKTWEEIDVVVRGMELEIQREKETRYQYNHHIFLASDVLFLLYKTFS